MTTIVTTYDLKIFELFYNNKYHDALKKDLILYIDKEDSEPFRKIITGNHRIFDRKDLKAFYGDRFLEEAAYCVKMMFVNMLFKMGIVTDSMYITDDDILCYDNSLEKMGESKIIEHYIDISMFVKDRTITEHLQAMYSNWSKIGDWYEEHFKNKKFRSICATNLYIPKHLSPKFQELFISSYATYHDIIFENLDIIKRGVEKTKSVRKVDTPTFYLEVPFFNTIIGAFDDKEVKNTGMTLFIWSAWKGFIKENETKEILRLFFEKKFKKSYPEVQPLLHFSISNKYLAMKNVYNFLNDIEEFDTIKAILESKGRAKTVKNKPLFVA